MGGVARALPRKMGLNCSMPAMVSMTVGSAGTRLAPGTRTCPCAHVPRTHAACSRVAIGRPIAVTGRCAVNMCNRGSRNGLPSPV